MSLILPSKVSWEFISRLPVISLTVDSSPYLSTGGRDLGDNFYFCRFNMDKELFRHKCVNKQREKTCIKCGVKFYGTPSSKYCIECKGF